MLRGLPGDLSGRLETTLSDIRFMQPEQSSRNRFVSLILFTTLCVTALIYLQGANGPFLLDDKANIVLNTKLQIDTLSIDAMEQAATSMSDTFTGRHPWLNRPIAYISFALNFYSAENATWAIKVTNIILHLITGLLVYWLTLRFANVFMAYENRVDQSSARAHLPPWIALWTAAFWLTHPLMVSTVLYAVQRMTQLSALFSLLALILFMGERYRMTLTKRSLWPGVIKVSLFSALAFLCKENGILVVVLCGVLELTLFRGRFAPEISGQQKRRYYTLLSIPIIMTLAFLSYRYLKLDLTLLTSRPFTASERVLTQIPVLFDYLRWLIWPTPGDIRFLHDAYPVSHHLTDPIKTLWSAVFWIATLAGGIWLLLRKQSSILLFGLLWFLGAHLLESSVLPLELVFEHRNYLPYVGPMFMLVYLLVPTLDSLGQRFRLRSGFAGTMAAIIFLIIPLSLTAERVAHWQSDTRLLVHWSNINSNSPRFWAKLADHYFQTHDYVDSIRALEQGWQRDPSDAGFGLAQVTLHCLQSHVLSPAQLAELVNRTRYALSAYPASAYERSQFESMVQHCPTHERLLRPLYVTGSEMLTRRIAAKSHFMLANMALEDGNPAAAIPHFRAVVALDPKAHTAQAALNQLLQAQQGP